MFSLRALFAPTSVAVLGASDNPEKLGFHVMKSLVTGGYPGRIFPINPGRDQVFGYPAYPALARVEQEMDLAILVLPAPQIPAQIKACASKGVKGVVLITAGFKEIDDVRGEDLEREVGRLGLQARIPIIGPNTFGLVDLHSRLNASFTPEFSRIKKGGVTLVSQSGGISHLLGFLAMEAGVGFSKIIGLGNRCNVEFSDLLMWLADDSTTKVIAMYMEGIDAPRAFLSEARRLSPCKPMVMYKVGSSEVADRASKSHTGSLAGSPEIYRGAFRQAGILSVERIEELLDVAKALAVCPFPEGPRVAILSGQAGPAMAAADACERAGLRIAPFEPHTQQRIDRILQPLALRTNPVDMGPAWYDTAALSEVVRTVLEDGQTHAILFLMMFASANASALKGLEGALTGKRRKPLVSCIHAPPGVWDEDIRSLEDSGALVNYPTPGRAARALAYLWQARTLGPPRAMSS